MGKKIFIFLFAILLCSFLIVNVSAGWFDWLKGPTGNVISDSNLIYSNDGTDLTNARNGASTIKDSTRGTVLSFDGKDDSISLDKFSIGRRSDFTYSFWVKINSVGLGGITTGSGGYILDRTSDTKGLASLKAVTGNKYGFQIRYDDGSGLGGPVGGDIKFGTWQHIALVRDSNQDFFLYVDGNLVSSVRDSGRDLTVPAAKFGGHYNSGNGFNGYLDDIRVYSEALTETQIKELASISTSSGGSGGGGSSSICGNGILETGEQCDDGKTNSGDGCSNTCQYETADCSLCPDIDRDTIVAASDALAINNKLNICSNDINYEPKLDINQDGCINSNDFYCVTAKVITTDLDCSQYPEPIACTDTDGGRNYYVKGQVSLSSGELEIDRCAFDENYIYEGYCNLDPADPDLLEVTYQQCPNGCFDGACMYALGESAELEEGDIVNFNGNGDVLDTKIYFISSTSVKLTIEGQVTPSISEGSSLNLGGLNITVFDINYNSASLGISSVKFTINELPVDQVCQELIDQVSMPKDFVDMYGNEYSSGWNNSYRTSDYFNGREVFGTVYQSSWSTGRDDSYTTEDGKLFYKYRNQYLYATTIIYDDENVDLSELFNRYIDNGLCRAEELGAVYDDEGNITAKGDVYYICSYNPLDITVEDEGYKSSNVLWYKDNVFVSIYISSYESLNEEEIDRIVKEKAREFLEDLKDNRFHWSGDSLYLDYPAYLFVEDSIRSCGSDVAPKRGTDGRVCYSSWQCKLEPTVCPEYGYQKQICTSYSYGEGCYDQRDTFESTIQCSPGICSGCYVPRWLGYGNGDNICIPYGTRLAYQDQNNYVDDFPEGFYGEGGFYANLTILNDYSAVLIYGDGEKELVFNLYEGNSVVLDLSELGISEKPYTLLIKNVVATPGDRKIEFTVIESFNAYCDVDGQIKQQKDKDPSTGAWALCQNNYECSSNLCSGGNCIEVNDLLAQGKGMKGLFVRVLCRLANVFDQEDYNACIAEYLG